MALPNAAADSHSCLVIPITFLPPPFKWTSIKSPITDIEHDIEYLYKEWRNQTWKFK